MIVYDPRIGTEVETSNPILILADLMGSEGEDLDPEVISEMADFCDKKPELFLLDKEGGDPENHPL